MFHQGANDGTDACTHCGMLHKRIDIRKHLAHKAIKNGHLILRKVPTTLQLADSMTKDVKQARWGDVHGWAAQQAVRTLRSDSRGSGG